jgi:hypothetical protein
VQQASKGSSRAAYTDFALPQVSYDGENLRPLVEGKVFSGITQLK